MHSLLRVSFRCTDIGVSHPAQVHSENCLHYLYTPPRTELRTQLEYITPMRTPGMSRDGSLSTIGYF